MTSQLRNAVIAALFVLAGLLPITLVRGQQAGAALPNLAGFPDPTGLIQTFSQTGSIDLTGPFFQSLGTNGRSCGSCQRPAEAWTVSADEVRARFEVTQGLDPMFQPTMAQSAIRILQAYKLLIERA